MSSKPATRRAGAHSKLPDHPRAIELTAWLASSGLPPALQAARDLRWSEIPGGAVNLRARVIGRVGTETRQWFVRFAGHGSAALGARLAAEALAHAAAAAAGLAPSLFHVDAERGVLVTDWWPSRPWTWRGARRELSAFGTWAARLHALTPPAGLPLLDPLVATNKLVQGLIESENPVIQRMAQGLAATLAGLSPALPLGPARPVLVHSDLHAANLLRGRDGTTRAVDFEYAGVGEPCHDLAVFASCHDLAPLHRRELLGAYAVAGGLAPGVAEFDEWCRLADVLWLAWIVAVHGEAWQEAGRAQRVAQRLGAVS